MNWLDAIRLVVVLLLSFLFAVPFVNVHADEPANLINRAENALNRGDVREAWRFLDLALSNYPTETPRTSPVWLRIADASLESHLVGRVSIATWSDWADAAVSCTFDDRLTSHIDVVEPDLREFGFPGTFYVLRDQGDTILPLSGPRRIMWQRLAESRHEVGNHTATHPKLLPSLSPLEIVRQLDECSDFIDSLHDEEGVTTFAYPFGRAGPPAGALRQHVRSRFIAARTTDKVDIGPNPSTPSEMDRLLSFSLNKNRKTLDVIQRLDEAIVSRGWLILTFHKVASGKGAAPIKRPLWEGCLKSLDERRRRIWIDTVENIAIYIHSRRTALVMCEQNTPDEMLLSIRSKMPSPVAKHRFELCVSVRVPSSWRAATIVDSSGAMSSHLTRNNRVAARVVPDGRMYSIVRVP